VSSDKLDKIIEHAEQAYIAIINSPTNAGAIKIKAQLG
jgi:hypothetical protein